MENKEKVDFRNVPLNIYVEMKGWMAQDAILSDRICTQCGRYLDSHIHMSCVHCGSVALDFLKVPDGTKCCIVEGSFFPVLTKGTEERWKGDLAKYTKYLIPKYGFRVRSIEQNGVLQPPIDYVNVKKSSLIQFSIRNHPWLDEPFLFGDDPAKTKWPGRKGVHHVFGIRFSYGDTFKILRKADTNKAMCSKDGNATVNAPPTAAILPAGTDPVTVMKMFIACGQALGLNMNGVTVPPGAPAPAQVEVGASSQEDESGISYPDPDTMW